MKKAIGIAIILCLYGIAGQLDYMDKTERSPSYEMDCTNNKGQRQTYFFDTIEDLLAAPKNFCEETTTNGFFNQQ